MTISNYRKIYKQHNGPIPTDKEGRTYEIHHIDGNHRNNSPENLKAVSIQEHYDIHKSQGDWYACLRIAEKMKLSHTELSELASKAQQKRVADGTHNFLGPESNQKRVEEGTHNFLTRPDGTSMATDRVADGTHPLLGGEVTRKTNARRIKDGSHIFLGENNPSYIRMANGTHHFITNNPARGNGGANKGKKYKRRK